MEKKTKEVSDLQWHPACYASVQIEFYVERMKMLFENEHQLGTKPKEIDILIIKKNSEEPIEKNLGRIFRKHNILEYKSPRDYLSIDDFYKVYAYACLYKADAVHEDEIKVHEITISFICRSYPRKMAAHLKEVRGYKIIPYEEGIYYITGDIFPMQLIVTSELSKEKNFWLRNLTNDIKSPKEAAEIFREYEKNSSNKLYQSVMDIIVSANEESFEEVRSKSMCQALINLWFKDEYEEGVKIATEQGMQQGMQQGIKSMVEACKSLGASWEKVLTILMEKFSLEEEQAEEYMHLYW